MSLQVILSNPKAVFKRRGSQPGMQESDFLKQITTVEELEPKANNCTKVLIISHMLDLEWQCWQCGYSKSLPPLSVGSCVAHSDREGQSSQWAKVSPGHSEYWGVDSSSSCYSCPISGCGREDWSLGCSSFRYCSFFSVQQPLLLADGHLSKQSLSVNIS